MYLALSLIIHSVDVSPQRFSKVVCCEVTSELGIHSSILFTVDYSHTSHVFNIICYTLLKRDFQVTLEKILQNIPETHLRTRA